MNFTKEVFSRNINVRNRLGIQYLPDFAVKKKCHRLGIEVVVCNTTPKTTTTLELPKELFSVEEALKMLATAFKAACSPGLVKVGVQKLQLLQQ